MMNKPDFILVNGKIRTGEPAQPVIEAFASVNGSITATGSTREILDLKSDSTKIFDAEGRLVTPGFTDSHVHFILGGLSLLEVNMSRVAGRDEFQRTLTQKAGQIPEENWILGGLWDNNRWSPPDLPNSGWIDNACGNHPVYLVRQDMHMALANRKALETAGITGLTPNPDGGRIDRDTKTGYPTGILRDAAMRLVERVIPPYNEATVKRAIELGCAEARRFGITCVHDITKFEDIELIEAASKNDFFTLRFRSFPPIRYSKEALQLQKDISSDDKNRNLFKVAGVKAFTDGSLGSHTALFFEPYADAPDVCGLPNDIMFPEGNLLRLAKEADSYGLQMIIHAIGDRANAELLDIYRVIQQAHGKRDRRWRIEHAQHVRPEDVRRFFELGVIASVQPHHCVDDARWAEKRLGKQRCANAYTFKSFIEQGIKLVFGTDWTVAPLNPVQGIAAAVNRIPAGDSQSWFPGQRLSVEEAMQAYTVNPPFSVFDEARLGTIEPGKAADCVILSDNIFEIPPDKIPNVRVIATIFDGKIVYTNEKT